MRYDFSDCELDLDAHVLRRDGAEVHLEPQVFDLLACVVSAGGALVSYDDLIDRVWHGRIVSDATLATRISAARAAVGDDGKRQAVIRTLPRRGVQLAVPAAQADPLPAHTAPGPAIPAHRVRLTASADGSGIAWSRLGAGPPLLRAGHWMTHLEKDLESPIWRPWLDALGRGRTLVRYDPRGTGMSDRTCGARSLEAHVADMAAVADAAALDRFDLFGTSQSAAVACVYAAQHPQRVRRLVIYGGFAQGSQVRDAQEGQAMTSALATMIRTGWGQPAGGYMRAFSSLFIPGASDAQLRAFVEMQLASASPDAAVEIRECCARYDVVDWLPKVRAPTLVVHGAHDNLHPYSQGQLFARGIPDASIRQLDTANHVLLPDEPAFAELMAAIDTFLTEDT